MGNLDGRCEVLGLRIRPLELTLNQNRLRRLVHVLLMPTEGLPDLLRAVLRGR